MKAYKIKKGVSAVLIYIELIIVAVVVIYPLLWVLGSALNESSGISRSSLIPEKISLANFKKTVHGIQLRQMVSQHIVRRRANHDIFACHPHHDGVCVRPF